MSTIALLVSYDSGIPRHKDLARKTRETIEAHNVLARSERFTHALCGAEVELFCSMDDPIDWTFDLPPVDRLRNLDAAIAFVHGCPEGSHNWIEVLRLVHLSLSVSLPLLILTDAASEGWWKGVAEEARHCLVVRDDAEPTDDALTQIFSWAERRRQVSRRETLASDDYWRHLSKVAQLRERPDAVWQVPRCRPPYSDPDQELGWSLTRERGDALIEDSMAWLLAQRARGVVNDVDEVIANAPEPTGGFDIPRICAGVYARAVADSKAFGEAAREIEARLLRWRREAPDVAFVVRDDACTQGQVSLLVSGLMRSCFQLSSDPAAGPPATDEIGARIGLPAIEAQQSDTTRWGGYTAEVGYATDEARIVVRTAHAASKTADDCIAAQRSNPGRLVITVLPRDAPDLNELRDRPEIVFLCTIATAEQLGALCNAESAIAFFKAAQKEAKV